MDEGCPAFTMVGSYEGTLFECVRAEHVVDKEDSKTWHFSSYENIRIYWYEDEARG